jgi:hypothetical protein
MNVKKFALSLLPWIVFSVLVHRTGAVVLAAAAAAVLGLVLLLKDRAGGFKIIDVTGVVTFAGLALVAGFGGAGASAAVADFGRGGSTALIGLVMLGSVLFVPFTEQYARESVPQQYWTSPVFRATNRKISALWGAVMLVMAGGHLVAGVVDPMSGVAAGGQDLDTVGLLLNWVFPALLVFLGYLGTTRIAAAASRPGADVPVPAAR